LNHTFKFEFGIVTLGSLAIRFKLVTNTKNKSTALIIILPATRPSR